MRAVRVRGRWAWIPGGGLRFAPFFTPNLRLSVLDRLWVPNVVVGDISLSPDLFIWLSTPVVPDLLFELWLISSVRFRYR